MTDLELLRGLVPLAGDPGFRARFAEAKQRNKHRLADWLARSAGVTVDPRAMFDVHIKRIHEYKRQLMNILHAAALWNGIRRDPDADRAPRVKIIAGKAAPGYAMAKLVIKLINDIGATINADPLMAGRLQVVYPPDYNVSMAEVLIPAADLSEQISTAGMEASGTGNMKLAMNGRADRRHPGRRQHRDRRGRGPGEHLRLRPDRRGGGRQPCGGPSARAMHRRRSRACRGAGADRLRPLLPPTIRTVTPPWSTICAVTTGSW